MQLLEHHPSTTSAPHESIVGFKHDNRISVSVAWIKLKLFFLCYILWSAFSDLLPKFSVLHEKMKILEWIPGSRSILFFPHLSRLSPECHQTFWHRQKTPSSGSKQKPHVEDPREKQRKKQLPFELTSDNTRGSSEDSCWWEQPRHRSNCSFI